MVLEPRVELLIATHNAGKIRELQQSLLELPIRLRYLDEFPEVATVEEIGKTYEENATLKAVGYSRQTGLYALADDSGLEVEALGGGPGVFSARFGGESASDQDRTQKLLRELLPYQDRDRTARFVCCMALGAWQSNLSEPRAYIPRVLNIAEGKCDGMIAPESRGGGGFGYDPVFIPRGFKKTFGELSADVKAGLSHRGKALAATRTFLTQFLKST